MEPFLYEIMAYREKNSSAGKLVFVHSLVSPACLENRKVVAALAHEHKTNGEMIGSKAHWHGNGRESESCAGT